jgi:hypothetical protein
VLKIEGLEGLSQEVRAGFFLKESKSWKTSEGFEPAKSSKGRDEWSKFFVEN